MTRERLAEATIDARLNAYLHGAREGNVEQARHLHEMFDQMLIGKEASDGQLWLTEHGKKLLADMHRQLSHCEGSGDDLQQHVMEAVRLNPHRGQWKVPTGYVEDLRIAIAVANHLCEQRGAGEKPDVARAAQAVADSGEFSLGPQEIGEVYDEIASTVGGFGKFGE